MRKATMAILAAAMLAAVTGGDSNAGYRQRQYYSSWNYYASYQYHYCNYHYYPTATATTYSYHYVITYTAQPRYYYYYNPTNRTYWGRYDLQDKGYSLLAEKDRKEKLADIPESAFPKPGAMPAVPGAEDGLKMDAPPAAPSAAK